MADTTTLLQIITAGGVALAAILSAFAAVLAAMARLQSVRNAAQLRSVEHGMNGMQAKLETAAEARGLLAGRDLSQVDAIRADAIVATAEARLHAAAVRAEAVILKAAEVARAKLADANPPS